MEASNLNVRRRRRRTDPAPAVELRPAGAYEAVTRQMVENLAADIREIKNRLNGLLFMVAGTVLLDVIVRVAGLGAS